VRTSTDLLDVAARDAVIARLRQAAETDAPMDARTALVLNMTGPAGLLELVAADRKTRRHARQRIDQGLDGTGLEVFGRVVRKLIADAVAVASGGAAGV
jgi:hypothetical protein